MKTVRFGIIGIGGMGSHHANLIYSGKIKNAVLTAVCDTNPARITYAKENWTDGVAYFPDAEELMKSGLVDAVFIATPHYDHPPLAIKAFSYGLHVLSEKPAGVYTAQVEEMNKAAAEAAEKAGLKFGINFCVRSHPLYQKVREMVQSGELGELKRVNWIITNWYRSQSYYDSGEWRASWAGEGGGTLINQNPHQLDLLQWICGMPTKVRAFMSFGKKHNIEVEDDVTAYLEYPNGATGVYVTSTHDAPGTNRLEITGEWGKLVAEDNTLTFWRNRVNEREFCFTPGASGAPECWKCEIPVRGTYNQHVDTIEKFTNAILNGTPLLADGAEGINSLTISNAMYLSAWTDSTIDVASLDKDLFKKILDEKIATSTYVKEVKEAKIVRPKESI